MSTSISTSANNLLMAATFKPLTSIVDRWTFDDKLLSNSCYPQKGQFNRKTQIFTYLTQPMDDVIRLFSVPYFATAGHFCNIDDRLKEGKTLQAAIRIITTPLWLPTKIFLKCALFLPFVAIQTPLSLIVPYRTIISFFIIQEKYDKVIETIPSTRLQLYQELGKSKFYPLKSKDGMEFKGSLDQKPSMTETLRKTGLLGLALLAF